FSASGTGSSIALVAASTDATGQAEAALSIDDPTNRTITVTATANGQSATTDIDVVGTTVSISGPASIVVGQSSQFLVTVRDASGEPVAGKPVSVASMQGNTVTVSPATTTVSGTVDVTLIPA